MPGAYTYAFNTTEKWGSGEDYLAIDAYEQGNELAYINDYRTDISKFDDEEAQSRQVNCGPIEVTHRGKPHILIITLKAVGKNEELLGD